MLFVVFLATLMVPFEVTIVTNFSTVADLDWVNTYQGLAVPFLATGFGAFLLRQSFLTCPKDLEDAAALDGYGHWRFLWRVVGPAVASRDRRAAVFSVPRRVEPVPVAAARHRGRQRPHRAGRPRAAHAHRARPASTITFAGTIIAALPLVILLLVFQKQLVRGLTAGAVKG